MNVRLASWILSRLNDNPLMSRAVSYRAPRIVRFGEHRGTDIARSLQPGITWIIGVSDISRKLAVVIIAIMNSLFGCCGVWITGRCGLPCLLLHIWVRRYQRWIRAASHSFQLVQQSHLFPARSAPPTLTDHHSRARRANPKFFAAIDDFNFKFSVCRISSL